MFGRRKREEAAAAEAAREAERKALFARLAERPESICPFLGLEGDRAAYVDGVSDEHRCFAFGDPTPLSAEQQTRVCQEPGYGNCPRYLRGVLVIPTEELEALRRRPVGAAAADAPPPSPPPRAPAEDRRRRPPMFLIAFGVLAVATVVAVGWAVLRQDGGTAVLPTATATPSPLVTPEPSLAPQSATPAPTPLPTPPPVAWQWVGCEPDLPCADDIVRRDEMALFLTRAFELAPVDDADQFNDIADNQYRAEINAVAIAGLAIGCAEGLYCPDDEMTREEMASFVTRAFDLPPTDETFFTDVADSIHVNAINAVAAAEVAAACEGTEFCPLDLVTRGEMAGYLHRALNR